MPTPTIMRITIGTCVAAPDMKRCFAAWLKIGSMQTPAKSLNMISAIGRMPTNAAPTPAPMIACSAIGVRSEEHTSELQSLMRISYAVFCLKKKKIESRHSPHCEHHKHTQHDS